MASARYCPAHRRYDPKCTPCKTRARAYYQRRKAMLDAGTWDGHPVEIAPVATHIEFLQSHGVGTRKIAQRAGVSRSAIIAILRERPQFTSRTVAEAICGVWPDGYTPPEQPIALQRYQPWDGLDHDAIRGVESGAYKLTDVGLPEQLEIYRRHRLDRPKQAFTERYGVSKDVAATLSRALRPPQPRPQRGTAA